MRANAAQPMGFFSSFGTNLGATVEEFRSCFRRRARQGSSESGQFQGRDQLSVKRKTQTLPARRRGHAALKGSTSEKHGKPSRTRARKKQPQLNPIPNDSAPSTKRTRFAHAWPGQGLLTAVTIGGETHRRRTELRDSMRRRFCFIASRASRCTPRHPRRAPTRTLRD